MHNGKFCYESLIGDVKEIERACTLFLSVYRYISDFNNCCVTGQFMCIFSRPFFSHKLGINLHKSLKWICMRG